jgi:predicted phage terminase large subunit-like protein
MIAVSKIDLERTLVRRSLYDFVCRFWSTLIPEKFVDNWHVKYICDELQIVAERVFARQPKAYDLVINIPPGSSKSTICSEMFPAWCWTRDPALRLICSSYAMTLSLDLAERTRRILQSEKYQTLFPEIKLVNEAVGDLQNNMGGERVATATGAKNITGRHAHFVLQDDLINPNEMASEAETKSAIRFCDETLPSRTVNSALSPFVLIGQRLGVGDPYGHFLAKSKIIPIRHICIPAELGENVRPRALRNNYVDGLFDPVRLPQAELNKKREGGMTIFAFSGQYLQDPILAGGSLFLTENIKTVEGPPPANTVRRTVRSWDKASSFSRGCYTVGVLMAKDRDGYFWILDMVRGQWEATQREQIIRATAERDGKGVEIVIEEEAGGAGKESAQFTTRNLAGFRVRTYRPTRAKEQRAYGFSAQVNAGNVRMLRAPWNPALVNELQLFPHDGKYVDIVDSCSQAFISLTKVMVVGGIGALTRSPAGGLRKISPGVVV